MNTFKPGQRVIAEIEGVDNLGVVDSIQNHGWIFCQVYKDQVLDGLDEEGYGRIGEHYGETFLQCFRATDVRPA